MGVGCLVGCTHENDVELEDYVIDERGTHHLDSEDIWLHVSKSADGLLYYSIRRSDGGELVKSNRGMSSFSRWYMQWNSSTSQLWVYSGDIGVSVWLMNASGLYHEIIIRDKVFVKDMPSEFHSRLPHSLRTKWPLKDNSEED